MKRDPIDSPNKVEAGTTLRDAVARTSRRLGRAGIESAAADARILTAAAAGRAKIDLISRPDEKLGSASARRLNEMTCRRLRHEPVSRILGNREFFGRTFEITPATLDPRPDTETLVEAALELFGDAGERTDEPLRILDIGTGSGCIVVSLLAQLPTATALATDICPSALAVALRNAERHGVADRLRLRQCDMLEGVQGRYNLIVSNPPYIRSGDLAALQKDVVDYDPRTALDGGPDGLEPYRRIARRLQDVLAPSRSIDESTPGMAIFEVGAGQADDVSAIFLEAGAVAPRKWVDLTGHTRCVAVQTRR